MPKFGVLRKAAVSLHPESPAEAEQLHAWGLGTGGPEVSGATQASRKGPGLKGEQVGAQAAG